RLQRCTVRGGAEMSTDRDPVLQSLFVIARQDCTEDEFTKQVISRIDNLRRRALIGWIAAGLVSAALAVLLTEPVLYTVNLATQILPRSLLDVDDHILARVLAPMNSIAGLVALGLLGLRLAWKKIFRR
ncbi:MAG: hypothetical protein OEQ14_19340, partial [Gammaproteobacteria bacterium]|nr:hypothetical protein [Gammaproteobacteria bacterium]